MRRKELNISLEHGNAVMKLRIGNSDLFMAVSDLILANDSKVDDYFEKVLSLMDTIGNRSSVKGVNYLLLTCINSQGLSTKIATLCKDSSEALKELDIVCSLIESVSQGTVSCTSLRTIDDVLSHCIGVLSPFKYLFQVIMKRKRSTTNAVPHPIPVAPLYTIHSPKEYSYLASVFGRGAIAIGHIYSNKSIVVKLSDDHILRHIAIVGSTGSGKSTSAAIISEKAAEKGYAVVIVDWHGEYVNLVQNGGERVYSNPLKNTVLEPLSLEELIKREPLSFIEILESSLELTPAQVHILEDAVGILSHKFIGTSYCIDAIIDIIQNSSATARWFTESREALLRKLKPLSSYYLGIQWNKLEKIPIAKGKIHIFDVSLIPNIRVRRILSALLIRSIILQAQYNNIVKPILIVVDEAHNIFHEGNPLATLVAEVRKWGIGFVVVTQAPSMISPIVLKNTNTKIIHALRSSKDMEAVLALANLRKEQKKVISALKPGEALVVVPELSEPVVVKICRI